MAEEANLRAYVDTLSDIEKFLKRCALGRWDGWMILDQASAIRSVIDSLELLEQLENMGGNADTVVSFSVSNSHLYQTSRHLRDDGSVSVNRKRISLKELEQVVEEISRFGDSAFLKVDIQRSLGINAQRLGTALLALQAVGLVINNNIGKRGGMSGFSALDDRYSSWVDRVVERFGPQ